MARNKQSAPKAMGPCESGPSFRIQSWSSPATRAPIQSSTNVLTVGAPQMGLRPPKGVAREFQTTMQSLMRRATTPLGIRRKPRAAPTTPWQQDQTACPKGRLSTTTRRIARNPSLAHQRNQTDTQSLDFRQKSIAFPLLLISFLSAFTQAISHSQTRIIVILLLGVRPAPMAGRTFMFDFFGKEEKQASLAPSPVSTNLALAVRPEPISGRHAVIDVPGNACGQGDAAILDPATNLCLSTPPSQVARVIRIDSASFDSNQSNVAAAHPLTTQFLGSTPVVCNAAGKTVNFALSTSTSYKHPDSSSPLISNHPTATIPSPLHHQQLDPDSNLHHQRRPIDDNGDHQAPKGQHPSLITKSGQKTFLVSLSTERGLNPWSTFPRKDRTTNRRSDGEADLQSRPAKRRETAQLLTESCVQSLPTQNVIQIDPDDPSAPVKQTLSDIIRFDLASFQNYPSEVPNHGTISST
ncbi:hypothetical protein KEM48_008636 [Puccinia striiformis f. sp. tritici PST-130]|nr:hypothetical protein KEM48_008636 [Puccinia striiformis f. sp. tritici PST-130]